jgi:hypothetical protein
VWARAGGGGRAGPRQWDTNRMTERVIKEWSIDKLIAKLFIPVINKQIGS